MNEPISTVPALIVALGDSRVVAELFGVQVNAVSNWKARAAIPSYLQQRVWAAARRRRLQVAPELFPALALA